MPVQVTMPTGTKPVCPCLSRGKVGGEAPAHLAARQLEFKRFLAAGLEEEAEFTCRDCCQGWGRLGEQNQQS